MSEIPKILPINILTDTTYLNILLAVKDEKANNYKISNKINKDHSSTRKPIKELIDIEALIYKKGTNYLEYLLNKKWLTEEIVNYYLQKSVEIDACSESSIPLTKTVITQLKSLSKSELTKALVEMYLIGKQVPTTDNISSFFDNFSQFVRLSIDTYQIKHIDIDKLQKLFFVSERHTWNLPSIQILTKYKINFKGPETKKEYLDIISKLNQ